MRTHLVLSEGLVKEVDALVGKRRRSRFVEAAVREKLRRDALVKALEETAGVLSAEDYPHWATTKDVVAWVRALREQERGSGRG